MVINAVQDWLTWNWIHVILNYRTIYNFIKKWKRRNRSCLRRPWILLTMHLMNVEKIPTKTVWQYVYIFPRRNALHASMTLIHLLSYPLDKLFYDNGSHPMMMVFTNMPGGRYETHQFWFAINLCFLKSALFIAVSYFVLCESKHTHLAQKIKLTSWICAAEFVKKWHSDVWNSLFEYLAN